MVSTSLQKAIGTSYLIKMRTLLLSDASLPLMIILRTSSDYTASRFSVFFLPTSRASNLSFSLVFSLFTALILSLPPPLKRGVVPIDKTDYQLIVYARTRPVATQQLCLSKHRRRAATCSLPALRAH